LLARSLNGDDKATDATAKDTGASATADTGDTKSADESDDSSSTGPNAIALQLFSQALAAALSGTAAAGHAQANLANTLGNASTAASDDDSAEAISGIANQADATGQAAGVNGASGSMQQLASLLAKDISADAKGKTTADAALQQLSASDAKSSDGAAGTGDGTAANASNAFAHLGITSHFSLQHTNSDTNTATAELRSAVGSDAWNDELGGQLTWMTHQGIESGSLKVSPEHLGPVEVTISVQNGAASVWFGANHADTRAALEQALPRLREMFANQGMNLTDSGVSREPPRNQTRSSSQQGVSSISAVGAAADSSGSAAIRSNLGLVDTYA
jgi:flagellar hook-length control protein FliK